MKQQAFAVTQAARQSEAPQANQGCAGFVVVLLAAAALDSMLIALVVYLYRLVSGQ